MAASGPAAQAASQTLPYTGYLEISGRAANGPHDLEFTLWDDATASEPSRVLHVESFPAVAVAKGRFSVNLGSSGALPNTVWAADELFISVRVDGVTLAGARQRVASTPYARRAAPGADFPVAGNLPVGGIISGNGSGLTHVYGARLGEAVATGSTGELTVNGLNMSRDGMYVVVVNLANARPCNFPYHLRFNGDANNSNYASIVRQDVAYPGGSSSNLAHSQTSMLVESGSGARHAGVLTVQQTPSGRVMTTGTLGMEGANPRTAVGDLQVSTVAHVWAPASANVQSVSIVARDCGNCGGCTNGAFAPLGPGSSLTVYRAAR